MTSPQPTQNYLFAVAIGPVQDFIAVARRSRDLWFGSWLLSELSKAAAGVAAQSGELIFPAPERADDLQPGSNFDAPNKILALIHRPPEEVGKDMLDAAQARLGRLSEQAFGAIREQHFDALARDTARRQINDLIEFYWAAVPHANDADYARNRRTVEQLLAARKNTRDYNRVEWGVPGVYKSSLDGQREAVIPPRGFRRSGDEKAMYDAFGLRVGERLCGVGVLKRHGASDEKRRFVSTSHAAALPLLERLVNLQASGVAVQTAIGEYVAVLKNCGVKESEIATASAGHKVFGKYDGHILFSERLVDFIDERTGRAQLEAARVALRSFLSAVNDGQPPFSYYALLHGDGDFMGKAIDNQSSIEKHRAISRHLTRFAARVREIVPAHDGAVVYAGGDDVFAFLPVHKAVVCARALASEFKELLKEFAFEEDGHSYQPSLSAGILIAHHLDPLSDALDLVRAAEKHAKSVAGKDALAVTVSKRSGADRTVKGRWSQIDERLETFAAWYVTGKMPDGAAFELRDLHLRLNVEDATEKDARVLREAAVFEARRILQRKRDERGASIGASELHRLDAWLRSGEISLKDLADEMIVAREIARAHRAARLPETSDEPNPAPNED